MLQWKNFEYRSILGEVMDNSLVSCFLTHGVEATDLENIQITCLRGWGLSRSQCTDFIDLHVIFSSFFHKIRTFPTSYCYYYYYYYYYIYNVTEDNTEICQAVDLLQQSLSSSISATCKTANSMITYKICSF